VTLNARMVTGLEKRSGRFGDRRKLQMEQQHRCPASLGLPPDSHVELEPAPISGIYRVNADRMSSFPEIFLPQLLDMTCLPKFHDLL
jgi:hypothetical protein